MRHALPLFLLITLGWLPFALSAQLFKPTKDTTKRNRRAARAAAAATHQNVIKTAPLAFVFTRSYPLLYERKLSKAISIQAGVGLTGHNALRDFWENIGDNGPSVHYTSFPSFTNVYNDEAGAPLSLGRRKASLGYLFAVQPRAYLNGTGLTGIFAGIEYDFYRYNLKHRKVDAAHQFTGPYQKEHENIQDFMACFGYQKLFGSLSFETSLSIGMRKVNGTKYVVYGTKDGFATYTDDGRTIGIGLKLGYHF